jgi:two-component system, NarL family, nitrate/nitrite response regulator NarL
MIRLLIVHEVRLIADLTASALRGQPDLEVVACVHTAAAALTLLRKSPCTMMLVSVTLPQDGAANLLRALTKMDHPIKVLVTGIIEAKAMILHWLEAGAIGYIHTDESLSVMVQKVRSAAQGECAVSPLMAATLIARISELRQKVVELNGLHALNPDSLYAELSTRECEVLDLIEQRYTNQGIGNTLYIELGTVKNHVHNILDKLGVRTRQQAAIIARQAVAQAENARQN